jgi:hypothetical protein
VEVPNRVKTAVKQIMKTFSELDSLLIVKSLAPPQACLMPSKPVDIATASCRICKSPVQLLTNNSGITAMKQQVRFSGFDSILIVGSSLFLKPLSYPGNL